MGRRAPERWIVKLWRGEPCRARFIHSQDERLTVHGLEWADGHWLQPVTPQIPAALAARAHRTLRQLQRISDGVADDAARFTSEHRERRHRKVRSYGNLLRKKGAA